MDIGTLTGAIIIEDKVSSVLTSIGGTVSRFGKQYVGNLSSALNEAGKDILELTKGTGLATEALGVGLAGAAGVASVAVTGVAVAAGVAVAGIGALTAATIALGNRGSDVNDVAATFQNFAGSVTNANNILAEMRKGTLNTISDFDLMKDASKLMAGGVKLSADNFGTLTQAAFVLQNQGLGPTKDMLELVSRALLTGQTRLLQQKIGLIDTAKAEKEYAAAHNVEKLNRMQKAEADRIAILNALDKKIQEAGEQQRDFGESMEAAIVFIKNWGDQLASAVAASPHVMAAVDAIGDALKDAFGVTSKQGIDAIVDVINKFADGVAKWGPSIIQTIGSMVDQLLAGWRALSSGYDTYIRPLFESDEQWKKRMRDSAPQTNLKLGGPPIGGLNLPEQSKLKVIGFGASGGPSFIGPGVTGSTGTGVNADDTGEDKLTDAQKAMAKLTASAVPLTQVQKDIIEQFHQMGKSTELVAKAFGINEIAASAYANQLDFAAKQQTDLENAEKHWATVSHGLVTRMLDQHVEAQQKQADVTIDLQTRQFQLMADLREKNYRDTLSDNDRIFYDIRKTYQDRMKAAQEAFGGESAALKMVTDQIQTEYATAWFEAAEAAEAAQDRIIAGLDKQPTRIEKLRSALDQLARSFEILANVSGDSFGGVVKQIANVVVAWDQAVTAVDNYRNSVNKTQKALALLQGATAVAQATGQGSVGARVAGGALSGASIGSIAGPWGAAIGGVAGAVVGLVRGLKGLTDYQKQMRANAVETKNLQEQLVKSHRSMNDLIVDANLVGINIKEAFKWKDPEALKNIIAEMDQKTDLLNSAMQEYGFTWQDLGEKARGAKLAQLFDDLYAKTDILRTAGIDYHTILERQSKDYSNLVDQAIRSGTEIPESMRPTLEELEKMGDLFVEVKDEQGNVTKKFLDLKDVSWSKTMTQGFQDVTTAIYDLRDALLYGVGGAIDNINSKVIRPRIEYPESPDTQDPAYMARGGVVPWRPRGTDTVPAMLTPGETVIPRGRGGLEAEVVVPFNVDGQQFAEAIVRVARRL